MRFVFLSYNYSPDIDSPENWFGRVSPYIGSLECLAKENEIIRIEQINYKGKLINNGIQYFFEDYGKKKLYFPRSLHRFVKSLKPDIVVVNGTHYPLQTIQLRSSLGRKAKIIVQHHAEKPFYGIKKYLQWWASLTVNAYLFASREMGLEWTEKGNISSAQKIHEVMEVSSFFYVTDRLQARGETKAEGSPVFLWVGRLNQNKDPMTVVNAFLEFLSIHSAARLYMLYHTDELLEAIKSLLANDPRNKNKISLIGRVAHDEMMDWMNSADFIVSGSHYEGSGTAVCEAMSCGCIPVVTNIFSFRAMTNYGECGILYEPGNELALLSALKQTMQMNTEAEKNKVLQQFRKKLSFDAIAAKIQEVAASL
ncbi:MAG TPA: glycosyltransferase family 4 protein [Chitinophagaceae bacterium]|jgi:glycosyltransferase involved in cell wall biosynthesis|nr:glycosyltransferase family 4 protein [Chitinophagaceae bacterium]